MSLAEKVFRFTIGGIVFILTLIWLVYSIKFLRITLSKKTAKSEAINITKVNKYRFISVFAFLVMSILINATYLMLMSDFFT